LKFQSLQFSSCHFGGLQKICVEFSQAKKQGMHLSTFEFWKFLNFLFWNSKIFNFLLVILEVSHEGR
jgi:hypothetical protein